MSLETWKAEYYPVTARECKKEDALTHSQRKWEGLKAANLAKHHVYFDLGRRAVREPTGSKRLIVNDESCALCIHFHSGDNHADNRCDCCPVAKARRGIPCDAKYKSDTEGRGGPFITFVRNLNPAPMIRLLKKAEGFQ